jgi:CRP/FNR family transcriptional regulator, cyclic AMP receptor protein
MTLSDQVQPLYSISLFHGLTDKQLEIVSHSFTQKQIGSGELVIEQGASSDSLYVLLSGSVKVYRMTEDGEEINLAILGSGDVIGEMSLLDHQPRSAHVEALQESTLLQLSQESFRTLLRTYPDIAFNLLATLARRVRITDEHLESILSLKLEDRTWQILKLLEKHFPDGKIHLSHEELSSLVGATRARVTEALHHLEKQNKIKLSHRTIQIL